MNWRDWSPWHLRRWLRTEIAEHRLAERTLQSCLAEARATGKAWDSDRARADRAEARLHAIGSVESTRFGEGGGLNFQVRVSADILRRGMGNNPTFVAHMVELFKARLADAVRRV